jgi:hypothetical protein
MIRVATVTCICILSLAAARGQQTPPVEPQSTPSFATPDEQAQFEAAKQEVASAHWSDALAKLRPLHELLPDDVDPDALHGRSCHQ